MSSSRKKCRKVCGSGQKWPNLGLYWQKLAIFEFSPKKRNCHFLTPEIRLKKQNEQISIFGYFGPKRPILDSFWPKLVKRDFFKKALGTFLLHLQALPNCKVPEKSNKRFSRKAVTDGRTNGQTEAKFKVLTVLNIRRTKNNHKLTILNINSEYIAFFGVISTYVGGPFDCTASWRMPECLISSVWQL